MSSARRSFLFLAGFLVLLSVLLTVARLHTADEPLELDLTLYAVMAHEVRQGVPLYSGAWEQRPPAIFLTYALGELLGGYGPRGVLIINVAATLLSLFGIYFAATAVRRHSSAGVWAALLWALLCHDIALEANQPNTEAFINACLVWAFAIWVGRFPRLDRRRAVLAGLLWAAASLYKHTALLFPVVIVGTHVLSAAPSDRPAICRRAVISLLTFVSVWVSVLIYFLATDRLSIFWKTMIEFNAWYARSYDQSHGVAGNLLQLVSPSHWAALWARGIVKPLAPLALLAGAGFLFRQRGDDVPWRLWLAYAAASVAMIALPGKYYPQHFQVLLPVLAVGVDWTIQQALAMSTPRSRLGLGIAALTGLWLALVELEPFRHPAEEWARRKHGHLFIDERRMGLEIDRNLLPRESFYNWGTDTGLYFYSRRRPPTGILWPSFLSGHPMADRFSKRVLADLQAARPELFIVRREWLAADVTPHPILAWCLKEYAPLEPLSERGPYHLRALKGGALERRTHTRGSSRLTSGSR